MLKQNILQVYINKKDEITIAKGAFEKLSEPISIESVSISRSEAAQVVKALKQLISEIDAEIF